MTDFIKTMLKQFNCNSPVGDRRITEFEDSMELKLPNKYIEFLKISNGGEGFIGDNSYAILWAVEELLELNYEYKVKEYAPGLLLFGSNGGGEAFAFDIRKLPWNIVQVPFVGMDLEYIEIFSDDFFGFLECLYNEE